MIRLIWGTSEQNLNPSNLILSLSKKKKSPPKKPLYRLEQTYCVLKYLLPPYHISLPGVDFLIPRPLLHNVGVNLLPHRPTNSLPPRMESNSTHESRTMLPSPSTQLCSMRPANVDTGESPRCGPSRVASLKLGGLRIFRHPAQLPAFSFFKQSVYSIPNSDSDRPG